MHPLTLNCFFKERSKAKCSTGGALDLRRFRISERPTTTTTTWLSLDARTASEYRWRHQTWWLLAQKRERERESRTCTIAHRVHVHVFRSTDPGQVSILLGSFALAPRSVSCRTNESKDELEERRGFFFVPWSKRKGSTASSSFFKKK